jgi:hypothetical protein
MEAHTDPPLTHIGGHEVSLWVGRHEGLLCFREGFDPDLQGPGWDSPLHIANIFPRTRKVGSPHAVFSVASGSTRQIFRSCFSGSRTLGMCDLYPTRNGDCRVFDGRSTTATGTGEPIPSGSNPQLGGSAVHFPACIRTENRSSLTRCRVWVVGTTTDGELEDRSGSRQVGPARSIWKPSLKVEVLETKAAQ